MTDTVNPRTYDPADAEYTEEEIPLPAEANDEFDVPVTPSSPAEFAQDDAAVSREELRDVAEAALQQQMVRDALAARVHQAEAPVNPEAFMREQHAAARLRLTDLRDERDQLGERIREMVRDEEVLARVVAVFDRARAARQDEEQPL